jgi:hypothetical protein
MPLSIYLLFLAYLNQRHRPTMLSGPWDFAGVLLGLCGFIVVGGPMLLAMLDSAWRSHLFRGNFAQVRAMWSANNVVWSTIAIAYAVVLISGICLFIYLRRKVTVIYNVDAGALEDVFVGVLDALGINWRRVAGGFELGGRKRRSVIVDEDASQAADTVPSPRLPQDLAGLTAFVQLDVFPSLCHATLRWYDYDPPLRREVEIQLEKLFATTESPENPAGGWFMTAAVALFFIMLLWMGFLIYQMFAGPKMV